MKDNQLLALEKELESLFPEFVQADERSLFEIGIKFGRQLEKLGIEKYECEYWKQQNIDRLLDDEIASKVAKVEMLVKQLVILSVKELITENGSWTIAKEKYFSSTPEKFSDETVNKYQVQVKNVDMESYGGEYKVTFEVVGDLGKKFKNYNVFNEVHTFISNDSGGEEQSIYDVERVDKYIDDFTVYVQNSNNWNIEQYDAFIDDISKPFIFLLLQR